MSIRLSNKHCKRCDQTLQIENFYFTAGRHTSYCKKCTSQYNMDQRRKTVVRRREKSIPEKNEKILSSLGDENRSFLLEGRFLSSYQRVRIMVGPWGMALDGELFYSTHDRDEIISILHSKNIKIMSVLSYDMAMPEVLESITSLRSSRREPISRVHARLMVSSPQYFLWMDTPRPLTLLEAADYLGTSLPELEFFLGQEKMPGTQKIPPLQNFKNLPDASLQPLEFTEE